MESNKTEDISIVMHDQHKAVGKKIGNDFYVPLTLIERGYQTEKEWIETDQTLKIHVTKARPIVISSYDYNGNYMHYDKIGVENWNVTFDDTGIPKTVYSFGQYYNPSTIAQYGLQHYSLYVKNKDQESKKKFLTVADWFLKNQDSRGGWSYHFDHAFFSSRLPDLKAPWYSAIGLGMAMSVLARASYLSNNQNYANRALRANRLFQTLPPKGVLAKFENKYSFYEECPTNPPSFILNGFMFALIGLYDLFKHTSNNVTRKLFEEGMLTLKRMLPLYDLGNRTAYDLTHYTTDGGFPNVAKWGYHVTHIHLLATLNAIEKDYKMEETLVRWKGYVLGHTK
ncbi:D-glucuronyl C5-epimerase family protein [Radiobacillus kanasensis]|uniref:D-glucuronyl C5-epimerase family protein n=1 Tax=Radiobacillus kanasensis TaxID=2844358 RepID=UPI001E359407|nr:D-glucuronyl C5-epimerase family protein [Radiobacillus kanasensis]UFU00037.1 D-glucuronyl C5-epimerase family protein [Radiobacillus kanasensis]